MKKYINFNNENTRNAANNFEKYFFKLIINSFYQKTIKNLQKRLNVKLINIAKDFLKYTRKPA